MNIQQEARKELMDLAEKILATSGNQLSPGTAYEFVSHVKEYLLAEESASFDGEQVRLVIELAEEDFQNMHYALGIASGALSKDEANETHERAKRRLFAMHVALSTAERIRGQEPAPST